MFGLVKYQNTKNQHFNNSKVDRTHTRTLGQRRNLVKNLLNLEARQNTIKELIPEVDRITHYSSEYNDNFCNSTMSSSSNNDEIQIKYPLYGGITQTVYTQLIMEGALKNRNAIMNMETPFRRNNLISLAPEDNFK